jgi:hypothetical protein
MARAAIVLSVLVSSPSDVAAECGTILTAIHDWNSSYSRDLGITLEPVQWQTHAKLVQIHNLKPRTGGDAIPMQFRLHLPVDDHEETKTFPALLDPSFKNIGGMTTYFMKLLG